MPSNTVQHLIMVNGRKKPNTNTIDTYIKKNHLIYFLSSCSNLAFSSFNDALGCSSSHSSSSFDSRSLRRRVISLSAWKSRREMLLSSSISCSLKTSKASTVTASAASPTVTLRRDSLESLNSTFTFFGWVEYCRKMFSCRFLYREFTFVCRSRD